MTVTYHRRALCFFSILFFLIVSYQTSESARKTYTAEELKTRIKIHNGPVVEDSDSLYLNDRLLIKGQDYKIDYLRGIVFTAETYKSADTLIVAFSPLPTWLKEYYGILPGESTPPYRSALSKTEPVYQIRPEKSSGIIIKGAKKFSILTRTGNISKFNQSLDLTITGELSPGLEITGSISDRGYNPAYGTINSQISELDKLNLKIKSRQFYSEIGNLEILQRSDFGAVNDKQVSGIQAAVYGQRLSASVVFARPRGRFSTVKLSGVDKTQGPYRISVDNRVTAIVPGSEKVWLDGQPLERGAGKDYVMDYPAGSITFSQTVLIDSRSRIEIDFEPLTTHYQQELYRLTSRLGNSDSTAYIQFGFMRQTDNKNRLKTGQLDADDIRILQSVGDSVHLNFRDGTIADSLGDYVVKLDSLGRQYYEYVGDSLGDYRVNFTHVGSGEGDYVYEGNNIYRYVGLHGGEYIPFIRIPVPSREDFYETEIGFKRGGNLVKLIVRQSDYDKNLYSNLNDNNNLGGRYILSAKTDHAPSVYSDKNTLDIRVDVINKYFKSLRRLRRPDLSRKYLMPDNLTPTGDQKEATLLSSVLISGPYNAYVSSGFIDYQTQFSSYYGTLSVYPDKKNTPFPVVSFTRLKAKLDSAGTKLDGLNEILTVRINYNIHDDITIGSAFKFDRRWNRYQIQARGTTDWIYDVLLKYRIVRLEMQRHCEDTLITDWRRHAKRDRAAIGMKSQMGAVRGEMYLVGQKSTRIDTDDNQFLARLNMSYMPAVHNLSVSGSYSLSDENRNERGVRYIEVEPGQGKFIYEDGQYIPDANGNYIEIEEIHSGQASVKKGEKSFNFTYYPSGLYMKLVSNISEDMLAGGKRSITWLLPFVSDGRQAYHYRKLYYSGELKFIGIQGGYFVNLAASYNFENRLLGGSNSARYEKLFRLKFNEATHSYRFSQEGLFFVYHRDSYYSSPGNIDGYKITLASSLPLGIGQLNSSLAYRFAKDADFSRSKLIIFMINPRIRFNAAGETSLKLESYLQELDADGTMSYRLTDDHAGRRGFRWTLRSDYKLKQELKISISFSGRHSDDKKPRIVGRGELVANF